MLSREEETVDECSLVSRLGQGDSARTWWKDVCVRVCMCILVCNRQSVGCLLGYLLYRVTVLTRRFDLDGESHADLPPSFIA